MPNRFLALSPSEPDPALLKKLTWVRRAFLAVVALIAVVTMAGWLIPVVGGLLPGGWMFMTAQSGFAALCGALSLWLAEPGRSRGMRRLSLLFAGLVVLLAAAVLVEYVFRVSLGIDTLLIFERRPPPGMLGRMSPQSATGYLLLGIELLLMRAQRHFASRGADFVAFCLCLLILILVSGYVFGAMRLFSISPTVKVAPQTLICLALLTALTVLCRAEKGVFAIFLGRGIGGRLARGLTPILLVLPFVREVARAHLVSAQWIPEHYATAILASVAAMLSFVLLLILSWYVNRMEMEIRVLTLRDELTGLYNLRGFTILGEHAVRVARRTQHPLSVLYIDLDNLKHINDTLGHAVGSAFLHETAELLKETFRETDVIGRIGGDEFAVICQCSHVAISIASQRLEEACAVRNAQNAQLFPLTFSVGYATAEEHGGQTLNELMTEADKAMYEQKREKKVVRS